MKKKAAPLKMGAKVAGGLYHGCFTVGNAVYALIVAPRDGGEFQMSWSAGRNCPGTDSAVDGLANTEAMAAGGSELARTIRALRLGDNDDWYLPSRSEALLAYSAKCKAAGFARDWYWTSTQHASYPDYAWCQGFVFGGQGYDRKAYRCRARAVRKIAICSFDPSIILGAA